MRITWNQSESRFEAEFSKGDNWSGDQVAASSAGFHSDGPPAWIWYTAKASSLTKLKEGGRPVSGLSITREALDAYNRLLEVERKNDELKKYIKEQKKQQKKAVEKARIEADSEGDVEPEYEPSHYYTMPEYWKGKSEITRADLPADVLARFDKHESIPQRRAEPTGLCVMCACAVYFYEKQDPPTCLWCEEHEGAFLDDMLDNGGQSAIVQSATEESRLALTTAEGAPEGSDHYRWAVQPDNPDGPQI